MQYGIYETILIIKNIALTKAFHRKARLIRYPFYIRNSKNINLGKGFTCGYNCRIESIECGEDKGYISFGDNARIGDSVHIAAANKVKIGKNVLMASKIYISDCSHGMYNSDADTDTPYTNPSARKIISDPVEIGDNVWIGDNVCILKGVKIGDGTIIGANAVVTKSVPEKSIAAGMPAKVIKKYNTYNNAWEAI